MSFEHCFARNVHFSRKRGKAIKTSSRQKSGDWREAADRAFCSTHDSSNVMDALIAFDKRSHWFVLVSPYKENRRGRRETTRGKGWSADYNEGELHTTDKCGATMVVWRGEIGLDRWRTRGCDTSKVKQLLELQGDLKSYQDPDIDLVRKDISALADHSHHFFIMWNKPGNSKRWKWTSYGMGIKESECLVRNSNSFFFMEPEQRKIPKTGGPFRRPTETTTTSKTTAVIPECTPADVISLKSANTKCKPVEVVPDCPPEQNVVAGVVTVKSGNINCKPVSEVVVKYDGLDYLLDLRTADI